MSKLACLILAAGAASRFGSPKQLVPIDDKPMISHLIDRLTPLFPDDLYCVLGAYHKEINPVITGKAHIIINENWRQGMGSSISVAIEEIRLQNTYEGVLIVLADQVAITKIDFQNLINLFDAAAIVAATYEGRLGVPAIFPADQFDKLQALSEDFGARKILKETIKEIITYPLSRASFDIDTPDDLVTFLAKA